jgi:hypothetical protein
MTSDVHKIKKLKALIAATSHPARCMSDAELAATIARLKD